MPLFDIIIPSYNNKNELIACIRGFISQTLPDFHIFVCIDGSEDGSVKAVEEANFQVDLTILEHPDKRNHGRNATRNLAFPYLKSEFVLFFDSDITPYPDLLKEHYQLLKQQNCISVGNVNYLNKAENIWAGYISTRGYNKFNHLEQMPSEYMNMGNLAMPSAFFIEVNGMDANLKKYGGDDSELCIRLEKAFHPKVVNNARALGHSVLHKSLDFALSQIEEFGTYNLKHIHRIHPGYGHIFAFDLMNGNNKKSRLFKFLMNKSVSGFLKRNISIVPVFLRYKVVHYLSAYYLYKGFLKK